MRCPGGICVKETQDQDFVKSADERFWAILGCCDGKRKDPAGWWNTDVKCWGSFDQMCTFDLQYRGLERVLEAIGAATQLFKVTFCYII